MEKEVVLHVRAVFSLDNSCQSVELPVKLSGCVGDLLSAIETELRIPRCDIHLTCEGRHLTSEDTKLNSLFLRDGLTMEVQCVRRVDIPGMRGILRDLREAVPRLDSSSHLIHTELPVSELLIRLSDVYLYPWIDERVRTQRRFLCSEGVVDIALRVLRIASDIIYKCASDLSNGTIAPHVIEWSAQLQNSALRMLWNFCEEKVDRQIVLAKDGLGPILLAMVGAYALSKSPFMNDHVDDDVHELLTNVYFVAVGCVVQFSSFEPVQFLLARSMPVMRALVSEDRTIIGIYPLDYLSEICMTTCFRCACSSRAVPFMVRHGVVKDLKELVKYTFSTEIDNPLVSIATVPAAHYACCCLARIAAATPPALTGEQLQSCIDLIDLFLQRVSPATIGHFEKQRMYMWISLHPFVEMLFIQHAGVRHDELHQEFEEDPIDLESALELHRRQVGDIQSVLKEPTPVPSSARDSDSVYSALAYEHRLTLQKMAVFCIEHLLARSDHHRQLVKERLEGLLICASWQIMKGELCEKLWTCLLSGPEVAVSPPSLKLICQAELGKRDGMGSALLCHF